MRRAVCQWQLNFLFYGVFECFSAFHFFYNLQVWLTLTAVLNLNVIYWRLNVFVWRCLKVCSDGPACVISGDDRNITQVFIGGERVVWNLCVVKIKEQYYWKVRAEHISLCDMTLLVKMFWLNSGDCDKNDVEFCFVLFYLQQLFVVCRLVMRCWVWFQVPSVYECRRRVSLQRIRFVFDYYLCLVRFFVLFCFCLCCCTTNECYNDLFVFCWVTLHKLHTKPAVCD